MAQPGQKADLRSSRYSIQTIQEADVKSTNRSQRRKSSYGDREPLTAHTKATITTAGKKKYGKNSQDKLKFDYRLNRRNENFVAMF